MTDSSTPLSNPAQLKHDETPFYGWKVVAAILILLTFSSGLSFYNHAVILNALAQKPNFTVQSASFAVSVFFIVAGFTGLWVARAIDRHDPRWCLTAGAGASALALTLLAWVDNIWQLYTVYALFGMGFSASALLPATTLVARWFNKRRAMALSIASTGLSLGGVILTPICAALVETLGLAKAAPIMGGMYLLGVIPISWLWIRPYPHSIGQVPDGAMPHALETAGELVKHTADSVDHALPKSPVDGISFKEARSGRLFWCITFGYVFLMMAQVGGIAHQYGLSRELLTEAQTAMVLAVLPIASIIGRLVGGWLLDRVSINAFAIATMIIQVVSLIILATGFSTVTLVFGLAAFGVSVGNLLMLHPLLIANAFGLKAYARIFAMSNLMSSWGTAAGPAILGFAYALSGNTYSLPYAVAALCGFAGLAFFLFGQKKNKK